jgi:phosphoesterase RecJ-like protein
VATAEILADCLPAWDLPVSQPVAAALLTGMITDTIGFRTANMTPKALRVAANLMETGIDMPELYNQALAQRSYEAFAFGRGFNTLSGWGQSFGRRSPYRTARQPDTAEATTLI